MKIYNTIEAVKRDFKDAGKYESEWVLVNGKPTLVQGTVLAVEDQLEGEIYEILEPKFGEDCWDEVKTIIEKMYEYLRIDTVVIHDTF